MSLNYDLRNVEMNPHTQAFNADKTPALTEDGEPYKWGRQTESLIFATMAVDMGEITEANAEKFYTRYKKWQRVAGSDSTGITYLGILAHAGLKTNVTTRTDAAFNKALLDHLDRDIGYKVKQELKSMDQTVTRPQGQEVETAATAEALATAASAQSGASM